MSPLIEIEELRSLSDHPIIIDARAGADTYQRYLAGHLEGAQYVEVQVLSAWSARSCRETGLGRKCVAGQVKKPESESEKERKTCRSNNASISGELTLCEIYKESE